MKGEITRPAVTVKTVRAARLRVEGVTRTTKTLDQASKVQAQDFSSEPTDLVVPRTATFVATSSLSFTVLDDPRVFSVTADAEHWAKVTIRFPNSAGGQGGTAKVFLATQAVFPAVTFTVDLATQPKM